MPTKATSFKFQGFDSPTTTPVPDQFLDTLLFFLTDLTDPELRVLLYIIRRTFGFKKDLVCHHIRLRCSGRPRS